MALFDHLLIWVQLAPSLVDLNRSMPPISKIDALFGSTAIAWSYQACPLVKSEALMPLSASFGKASSDQLTPLSVDLIIERVETPPEVFFSTNA